MALAIFDILKDDILSLNDPEDVMGIFHESFQFTKVIITLIISLFKAVTHIDNACIIQIKLYHK